AAAHADRTAVEEAGAPALTFAALAARAGRIATRLRAAGIAPGEPVGLLLPTSADHVAALVGVWWAGAAFVPLDPGLPAKRLAFMARDAGVRLAFARPGAPVLEGVEALDPAIDEAPGHAPEPADAAPGDLAYAI